LNTLVDFRHQRKFKAVNGDRGLGRQKTGKSGDDIFVRVPLGTIVSDAETGDPVGDVTEHGQQLLVAQGGRGGLGNVHFKSSTNRAPRKTIPGEAGELRQLHFELKVLADVGLLGFPNAGKSTLIGSVSSARPKVADYPFTTLYPNLGVVRIDAERSFVIADVPGLIEGAADGTGLGIQFLKHLQRTRLLLQLVDLAPLDHEINCADQVRQLETELEKFDADLLNKPRWLIFTKADLLQADEAEEKAAAVVEELDWQDEWAVISAVSRQGTTELMQRVSDCLLELDAEIPVVEEKPDGSLPEFPEHPPEQSTENPKNNP
jgi:GTP-binding protein